MGMFKLRVVLTFLFLSLCQLSTSISLTGTRTLIIAEEETKVLFSKFVADLEARGYKITTQSPKSETLKLFQHEERAFDNIILFPTKLKGLGPNLLSKAFLDYTSSGGNLLVLLPSDPESTVPTAITELASQVDVILPPKGYTIVDHFNSVDTDEQHNTLLLDFPKFPENVKNYFTGDGTDLKILYKGSGLAIGNSALVQPILKAPRFSYSYDPKEAIKYADDENIFTSGEQLVLIAGVQTRNNARITFVGGSDLFSDDFFEFAGKSTGNRAFVKDVSAWAFKETGVLRVDSIEHWGKEFGPDVVNGEIYRVKHDVTYSISLSEYTYDHFIPYVHPSTDTIQLEFTMLDPYYRIPLTAISTTEGNKNTTLCTTTFHTPDQHGVFTFHVNYKRPFLTSIHEKRAVTVRHFAHNEWVRSWGISGGWPWIGGVWSVVIGWIGFVAVWLWSKPIAEKKVGGKKL